MTLSVIFPEIRLFFQSETRSSHGQTQSDAYEPTVHTHRWAIKNSIIIIANIGRWAHFDIKMQFPKLSDLTCQ